MALYLHYNHHQNHVRPSNGLETLLVREHQLNYSTSTNLVISHKGSDQRVLAFLKLDSQLYPSSLCPAIKPSISSRWPAIIYLRIIYWLSSRSNRKYTMYIADKVSRSYHPCLPMTANKSSSWPTPLFNNYSHAAVIPNLISSLFVHAHPYHHWERAFIAPFAAYKPPIHFRSACPFVFCLYIFFLWNMNAESITVSSSNHTTTSSQ